MGSEIRVDDQGIHFAEATPGTYQVVFDDEPVWTLQLRQPAGPGRLVAWPPNLRPWLNGVSHLVVRRDDETFDLGEIVFGESTERIRFVDSNGVRIVVDKWGIRQRPFDGRDRSVVAHMVDTARTIVEVAEREVGVRLWMAFGTLLGAVREGGVIAHDADIDLAYLSRQPTPAAMAEELYAIRRALVRNGLRVINKTGSFITVAFTAPDGSLASIDVYTCFHLEGYLYETATVRAKVPLEAVEPLQLLEFEGVPLPAPADPDRLLAASYGPSWRTPDPSFQHRPGKAISERFDGWFGNVMRQRREWEVYWRDTAPRSARGPSEFVQWFADRLPAGVPVVDLGCGDGEDALFLARRGWSVTGLDYARGAGKRALAAAEREGLAVELGQVNLYDLRDALTASAALRRSLPAPPVLYTRSLVDAIAPDARDALWRFAQMLLRGGGKAFVEFHELAAPTRLPKFHTSAGRHFPVDPDGVCRQLRDFGGVVAQRSHGPVQRTDDHDGPVRRWRLVGEWS